MREVKKAVILVGGLGTRFLPITKSIGKPMLPIIDKPTIAYVVEEAIESGITDILFIGNSYMKQIEDYFDYSYELETRLASKNKASELNSIKDIYKGINFMYMRQGEPLGSAHAIGLAKPFVGDDPFAVLYCDNVFRGDIPATKQLINTYEKYECNVVGVVEVEKSMTNLYGIVEYMDEYSGKMKNFIEQPKVSDAPSTSACMGRYVFLPSIFKYIESLEPAPNGEYQITGAILDSMKTKDCYATSIEGYNYDTGNKLGYLKTVIDFALDREELKDKLREYLNNL